MAVSGYKSLEMAMHGLARNSMEMAEYDNDNGDSVDNENDNDNSSHLTNCFVKCRYLSIQLLLMA